MSFFLSEEEEREYMRAWSEMELGIDLRESLDRLLKKELDIIRKLYDFKGLSTLNKSDLIDELVELIPKDIIKVLYLLDNERYSLINKVINDKGILYIDDLDMNKVRYFKERALMFTGSLDDEKVLFIPVEIIKAIKEVANRDLDRIIKRNSIIVNLANGLLYHYGYMEFEDMVEMIEGYLGEELELFEIWLVIYSSIEYYDLIYHYDFSYYHYEVEEQEEILYELEIREDIDYYKFTRAQVLNAAKENYAEDTVQVRALRRFINSNYNADEKDVTRTFREIYSMVNNNYNVGELIEYFTSIYPLDNEEKLMELAPLLVDMHNNTRMWILKGNTPNMVSPFKGDEFPQIIEEDSSSGKKDNVFDIRTKKKIGRNDPCPCGSGLKYKRCCGK